MLDDRAEALDVTVVATFDSLLVSSCFFVAAIDTRESSLFEAVDILTGVDEGVEEVIFGRPGTTAGKGERSPFSSDNSTSSSVNIRLDDAASRIVRRNVTSCSS
jgi:hypothetical protein